MENVPFCRMGVPFCRMGLQTTILQNGLTILQNGFAKRFVLQIGHPFCRMGRGREHQSSECNHSADWVIPFCRTSHCKRPFCSMGVHSGNQSVETTILQNGLIARLPFCRSHFVWCSRGSESIVACRVTSCGVQEALKAQNTPSSSVAGLSSTVM